MKGKASQKFPSQNRTTSQKLNDKDWQKACIEGAEALTIFSNNMLRESFYNKRINYDLANGILDTRDLEKICNPMGFSGEFPATLQNYPIATPKLNLLVGEEEKRRFEWRVVSTSSDTASEKEKLKKKDIIEAMSQAIQNSGMGEEQITAELEKINQYYDYEYQDFREMMASDILSYQWKKQNLKRLFNKGMYDVLIAAEEAYAIDIVAGEPFVRKVDPLTFYTYGMGKSPYVEDSDIIIEDGYMSTGQVIDEYYEYLEKSHIEWLEGEAASGSGGRGANHTPDYPNPEPSWNADLWNSGSYVNLNNTNNSNILASAFDADGNIRVTRVVWKSRLKLKKVTGMDEDGVQYEEIVSENYSAGEGERISTFWVNEWWEGTRIGDDIYIKIQPRPVQLRSVNNLSKCHPGYVGTVYNINTSKARSMYDHMKPYQYLYNIFMRRLELAFSQYKGPIYELDISKKPADWDTEKWMYYAEVLGWNIVDNFNEGVKGASQGTLAGNFNTTGGRVMNPDISGFIRSNVDMLSYIEHQVGRISGVSEQREGQIGPNDLVGSTERAVTQSSHITEPYFALHDDTKLRVLTALLETAKWCYRNETDKTMQYVLDDMSIKTLKVDGESLSECDYDVFITNSSKTFELEQSIKQLSHAAVQNQQMDVSKLVKIWNASSMTKMSKELDEAEKQKAMQAQKAQEREIEGNKQVQEMAAQNQQAMVEAQKELKQLELDNALIKERVKGDEDRKTLALKLTLEKEKSMIDADNDRIPDQLEMEMAQQQTKIQERELDLKEKEIKDKKEIELKKIAASKSHKAK